MTVTQSPSTLELLANLSTSLASAVESVPETNPTFQADGISLLDTKNELLLSYVQNLVFLILIKIRNGASSLDRESGATAAKDTLMEEEVVKKLVELRVYLERGVRPLEGRLKYQIDKVLRAATDEARLLAALPEKTNGTPKENGDGGSRDEGNEDGLNGAAPTQIDELSYRPNPNSLVRPSSPSSRSAATAKDGIYRPPRITPTALAAPTAGRDERTRRPGKSATLDEYVNSEMSTAPLAEPSIGSTIQAGGRRSETQRERELNTRRRTYEEDNFVRLPKESKKERAKRGGSGKQQAGYGGEDWRGLGDGLDRIDRLTGRGKGAAVGGRAMLERSRKRPASDGPGGGRSGAEAGGAFEKRRKTLGKRNRRGGE